MMKTKILTILIAICAIFGASASQKAKTNSNKGILNGSEWINANLIYTAKVNADGTVTFTACDEGQDLEFRLKPTPKKNEYQLTDGKSDGSVNPFSDSSRAKLVRNAPQNLLCLYDGQSSLCDVLSPSLTDDGTQQAEQKWACQLAGEYTTIYDEPLIIRQDGTMRFSAIDLTYRHVTFNGMITGVIEVEGGTRLEGLWKAEITRDGLMLCKVNKGEYFGFFEPTGEEEMLVWSRTDIPRFDYASKILLNDNQFRRLDKSLLRLIRNEIWMHHGYVPASADLKEYIAGKQWYTPRENNDGIADELSIIETLNIELLKAAETKKETLSQSPDPSDRFDPEIFDIAKYRQEMEEQAQANLNYMKSLDDIKLKSYAFVDIDGDDIPEIWARGNEGQDFQGIFAITPDDKVILIQSSDARSELRFYPTAVGATGYYGEGEFRESITTVKDSRPAEHCDKRVLINNYSPEQEVLEESYNINDKTVTAVQYDAYCKQLGEPYRPVVQWYIIKSQQ